MAAHPYAGMVAALATMHRKEEAIAPPLAKLGLTVAAAMGIDTDALGTFSGEIERVGTMLDVAVRKARLGMNAMNASLGLASEGTFGPHPQIPLLPVGMEILVFIDDKRRLVICESLIVEETNFGHVVVAGEKLPTKFLKQAKFPSHALVVRPKLADAPIGISKGIVDRVRLRAAIAQARAESRDAQAIVQTDMRAHFNPTRMRSLNRLAANMAHRLSRLCPECKAPGFGLVDVERGLPCEVCGVPTRYVLHEVHGCSGCGSRQRVPRSDGLKVVEQSHCDHCNP
jgi:hypothetical protein